MNEQNIKFIEDNLKTLQCCKVSREIVKKGEVFNNTVYLPVNVIEEIIKNTCILDNK